MCCCTWLYWHLHSLAPPLHTVKKQFYKYYHYFSEFLLRYLSELQQYSTYECCKYVGNSFTFGTVLAANPLLPQNKIALGVDLRGAHVVALEHLALLEGHAHKLEGEDAGKSRGHAADRHTYLI